MASGGGHNTLKTMATKMTANGESTTTTPGTEQYEKFYSSRHGRKVQRITYDYRASNGDLFSTVAPTLRECRPAATNGSAPTTSKHNIVRLP